ncbi:polysaccharide deacetylase family protein [Sinobacterium norvegicum]|uniref:polysaccharide deacetylase family protein n=1 Tax=Sinobacterium norvegicum TaxID=1641715 RepID=UPI001F21F355|nr:polysaccharide deacetylase family protein [Sinobacterium norvegicum]
MTVLLYHHISDTTPRITSTTPGEFAQHLQMIEDNGFEVWPLSKVVRYLQQGTTLPSRVTVITFDDAYDSILTTATPMLEKRGWPFTVFVNSAAVDEQHRHIMSWQELNSLQDKGGELANHSHHHSHMATRLEGETEEQWQQRMHDQILITKDKLKQHTNSELPLFAYPYGEFDQPLQAIISELGYVGFGQQSGALSSALDFTALPRFPAAGVYANPKTLRTKLKSLPMPIKSVEVLVGEDQSGLTSYAVKKPSIRITLEPGDWRLSELACYVSNQGTGDITNIDTNNNSFVVTAKKEIITGRSRYNCTMPSQEGGRYHWYSHAWLRFNAQGELPTD